MSNTGDILVCQVGNNANYIGSHLWNTRDEDSANSTKMYHSGSTKRYPRCVIIEAPDNLGKLTTVDIPASRAVDSIWGGGIQTSVNARNVEDEEVSPKDPSFYSSHGAQFWTDFLKPELHSKSVCELPKWTGGEYYDSFHKGLIGSSTNDTLTVDYLDYVMDNCRYFAEGCDHLTTIEVLTEHVGGTAGLTTSLLQALREEFGNSVCIPVWSCSGRKSDLAVLNYDGATLLDSIATMRNKVSVLDSALFYNKSIEYCNVMVPISLQEILSSIYDTPSTSAEDKRYNTFLSTAVAAAAVSTACSYHTTAVHHATDVAQLMQGYADLDPRQQHRSTFSPSAGSADAPQEVQVDNAHQWCAAATNRGRLPLAFLEAGFPGILKNREKLPSDTAYLGLEQYLIDSFDTLKYPLRASKNEYLRSVNPFTVPLSPVPFAYRTNIDSDNQQIVTKRKDFPYRRAFSNMISVRGVSGEGLREGLYSKCGLHPYRISSCQLNAAPLYVSTSSPFYNDTSEEQHAPSHTADGQYYPTDPAGDAAAQSSSNNNNNNSYGDSSNHYSSTSPYHSDGSCVELVSAVHTSALVGEYLSQQAGLWDAAVRIQAVAVQLNKAGMDRTECAEVAEQLRELSHCYSL